MKLTCNSATCMLQEHHIANSSKKLCAWGLQRHHCTRAPSPPCASTAILRVGFSQAPNLQALTALHALSLRRSLPLVTFHSNTLLAMYSKFGRPSCALKVFDEMPRKNPASWNAAVSTCVNAGMLPEAFRLLGSMRMVGVALNAYTFASIVTGCDRAGGMVYEGLQLHGLVQRIGLGADVFVGTTLVHFYGSCCLVREAKRVFHEMPFRNVVSWTAMMASCSKNGLAEDAVSVYRWMRREGITCNGNSFSTVVSSCCMLENESFGLQILTHAVVSGYATEVSVGNSMIALLGCLDKLDYAEYVFREMDELDVISWNSMISVYSRSAMWKEALGCFDEMRSMGWLPDSSTLSSLIFACSSIDCLKWGAGLHGYALVSGLCCFVSVSNTLITMYSSFGRYQDAECIFQEIPAKDLICWNSMISSYVQSGNARQAVVLFALLLCSDHEPNHITFANVLSACSGTEFIMQGKCIHAIMIQFQSALKENLFGSNALISMYCNCNSSNEAKRVFQVMPFHDVVSWNALIGGLAENEVQNDAMGTFNRMRWSGNKVNYITLTNILGICNVSSDLIEYGKPLHAHMISLGFENDGFVRNSILAMYARCGDYNSSKFYFDELGQQSAVSWNALINSMAHDDQSEEALKLFKEMHCSGLQLDQFSLSGGHVACANLASLEEGQQLHCLMVKLGFDRNLHATNAVMDMYGKCGEMDAMLKVFPNTCARSRQAWNILISGYARLGRFTEAKETFEEMLEKGPRPDYITFVNLLSACNHSGLVNEGLEYFSYMKSELGITATIEHCVCIVDLLGRSGRLVEAEKFIDDMPVPPNDVIWRSLLASSRIHGNLQMGAKAAACLLEFDSTDDSAYILLSNVCAKNRRWEDVHAIRTQMKSINLRKRPACSWIKVKNKVYTFGIGDVQCLEAEQVYAKLIELRQMVKDAGYEADTTFSLHDIDEEQKEQNLWYHSEKLALAFGLISLPDAPSIRVFKNLRVCGDCHLVFKLVSGIVHREIILRDCYRFHHFKDGNCSCSDYW